MAVGEDGPPVAVAAQWLRRKEARRGNGAETTHRSSIQLGAERLRGVREHPQAVLSGKPIDTCIVGRLAEQVHCDDGFRLQAGLGCRVEPVR